VSQEFLVIGHRGAMGHAPENTLRSVRRALELGAHGVEVDVHFVDGELLVFHDDDLGRTTNGKGRIQAQTLEYLRSLDAGEGEKIPTLREVCDALDERVFINVELKGPGTAAPVTALIDDYVRGRHWPRERFLVSSFDEMELRAARALSADLRIGYLAGRRWEGRMLAAALELRASSMHLATAIAAEPIIAKVHSAGLQVLVYTVNEAALAMKLEHLDVSGVFTDFPDRILRRHQAGVSA
jgi:glycerophosphoryl diester phosphodiesterase